MSTSRVARWMGSVIGLAMLCAMASAQAQTLDTSTTSPTDPSTSTNAPDTAAPPSPSADLVQRRLAYLTKQLTLTPAQQSQLLPILQAEQDKENATLGTDSQGEDNVALREIRKAARQHIAENLTPQQREIFVQLKPFVRAF